MFAKALSRIGKIESCIEFGANIGLNLKALKTLYPNLSLGAIEINTKAAHRLQEIEDVEVINDSILNFTPSLYKKFDLVLVKGVLIHINPKQLKNVYEKMYNSSKKYILISEYYSPVPVNVLYHGKKDRLFKRDFAGEILDLYRDLKLIDYGFVYHRDTNFPQDDSNCFLIEKI